MSSVQKVIKYLAIAFALFLVVNIISAILFALSSLSSLLGLNDDNFIMDNLEVISGETTTVSKLDIDIDYTNLQIKRGEALKVETNNSKISFNESDGHIEIKEEKKNWFSNMNNSKPSLIVYIPENIDTLETVRIENGAGIVEMDHIKLKELNLKLGAGKVFIKNLNVLEKMKLDGGAGKTELESVKINNLDADLGVGEFIFRGTLTGNNNIDAGVGSVKIRLEDYFSNYSFNVNKGIGAIKLQGKDLENDRTYGDGDTKVKIDGGVGSIEIY